ncbi:serine hydrolase domain-containing protein [Phenylobacterium sp.]|uniref:serine hydrolase domain-containing protein n=1 Tax=Phenylobacterium sp. TaxID=1871053 RepID=UPI002E344109|nr:serine hydrolase domain-containing protein [Phenylobacterium sp.]HEX3364087.1 serine hydrolase domain-containing protein [Phenylobacterium sp.]
MSRTARLVATILALAAPVQAFASPAEDAAKIRAIVGDPLGDAAPGCAVGVFKDGQTQFVSAGSAEIGARRAPNGDTRYYSGSLAKQFTALSITQLIVAGRVQEDDDVRKFIPEMPVRRTPITVALLLHHTSGIPNSARMLALAGYDHVRDSTRPGTMQLLFRYPAEAFPPGSTFEYSNGGYLLLSEIVERVSGQPFADYVQDHILKPIGMTRSTVLRGVMPDDANRALGYTPKDGGFVVNEDFPLFGGAGAMLLTINDLAKYHQDIVSAHRVWTPEVARRMTEGGRYADGSPVLQPRPGSTWGYASGLMLSKDWVLHDGNFAGFQAVIAWLPDTTRGIAMLCNRGDVRPVELATRIMAAIDPSLPVLDTSRYPLPGLAGRFGSETAGAVYEIRTAGADLEVTVSKPTGGTSSAWFERNADGAFTNGPITLTFDPDHRGFVASDASAAERFHRLP